MPDVGGQRDDVRAAVKKRSTPATDMLLYNPRLFWGNVVRIFIERGWEPPKPDEHIVEELLRDMEQVGVREPVTAYDGVPLSPAETRVAMLLHTGMSNPDISRALHVSTQTVKFHLTSIYRKLGVDNRTEAALMLTSLVEEP